MHMYDTNPVTSIGAFLICICWGHPVVVHVRVIQTVEMGLPHPISHFSGPYAALY